MRVFIFIFFLFIPFTFNAQVFPVLRTLSNCIGAEVSCQGENFACIKYNSWSFENCVATALTQSLTFNGDLLYTGIDVESDKTVLIEWGDGTSENIQLAWNGFNYVLELDGLTHNYPPPIFNPSQKLKETITFTWTSDSGLLDILQFHFEKGNVSPIGDVDVNVWTSSLGGLSFIPNYPNNTPIEDFSNSSFDCDWRYRKGVSSFAKAESNNIITWSTFADNTTYSSNSIPGTQSGLYYQFNPNINPFIIGVNQINLTGEIIITVDSGFVGGTQNFTFSGINTITDISISN